jgi:ribonuclease P protein component
LPKHSRLTYIKKHSIYKLIHTNSLTKKYNYLVVKFCKKSAILHGEDVKFLYGITITKKYGNAVKRNLLKRRLKAIIREVSHKMLLNNIIISIYPKYNAKNANFAELKKEVDKILNDVKNHLEI